MELKPLTREDCQTVRVWRNKDMSPWRTPYPLTEEMQDDFYKNVICNRNSPNRYLGIWHFQKFVGIAGLTNIIWENRTAEITILIDPEKQGGHYGKRTIDLILDYGFNTLNLKTIFGECYLSNKNGHFFWQKIVDTYNGYSTILPNRKYWNGQFWNSLYFSIDEKDFKEKDNEKIN